MLFAPTDKGFGKWCFEVRKSKAFMKTYSLLSDESRLWHLAEYQERKKLLGQLSFVKSQLNYEEEAYLSLLLTGRSKLDHRVMEGDTLFDVWKESEELLIAKFRAETVDISTLLKKSRERLGMSITEITTIIGVSIKTYSNYEKRKTNISAEIFLKMMLLASIKYQ